MAADPTTGRGGLSPRDAVSAARAARLLREQETKRRYQDVVSAAERRLSEENAADPVRGRISPGAGASRNRGIDRALVEATGIPQLVGDAYWSVTHPVDRLMGRGRAAEQSMVIPFGPFRSGRVPKPAKPNPPKSKPEPVFPVEGAEQVIEAVKPVKNSAELEKLYNEYLGLLHRDSLHAKEWGRLDELRDVLEGAGRIAPRNQATPPVAPRATTRAPSAPIEKPPEPAPSVVEGADRITGRLPEAKKLRRSQEDLYRAERGKRAGKAEEAMEQGGQAGYRAALEELRGELPKIKFGGLEQFDQQTADALFTHVQRHPELRTFEKIRTQGALRKVLEGGTLPTRSEIKLLERTFGPDVARQITDSVSFWQKAKNVGLNLINVPRAMRASADLSAPFRQGLVLGARHPRMFASEWAPMLKSFRSERAYEDVMEEIASRPTFDTMQKAKLQLTDLEGLAGREEQFMSNYAERIPAVGRVVRASGRGYTAFLNKFRADAFDNYLRMAEAQGLDVDNPELLQSIARWVNHATGRGSIKQLEGAMVPLNALLFSPRLIASRLQLLNPVFYGSLDPFARRQALQGMGQLLGGISLTLGIAKLAGADVVDDPRNTDFGKIKVGDTRVDIAGGFQQYLVAASRLVKGEMVSSSTGEVRKLDGGFAKPSRADIVANFAENKLAPVPSYVTDLAKNENFAGDEPDPLKEAGRMFLPLGAENAYEGFNVGGPAAGVTSATLGSIGFGVQTYKSRQADERAKARKQIRQMVRDRQINQSDADALLRQLDEAAELEKLPPRERTLVWAVKNSLPLDQLNQIVDEPYTEAEYDDAEMDVLEQRAVGR